MNRQFIVSGIVLTIVALAIGFVVHAVLLADDYAALTSLMRPAEDQQHYIQYNLLAHVLIGFSATWIYRQGMDPAKPPLWQGIRFGIAVACLATIPIYLIYYAVEPFPGMVVVKQIVFDTIGSVILGIAVAFLNRAPAPA